MSTDEFVRLPVTFGAKTYADIYGCNPRFATDHAVELGAMRHAGRWVWSKARVAADLGITLVSSVNE